MSNTLSQRIESELRNAVGRGGELPFRLTLVAMAEHFNVSIQPVRTAVDNLLGEELLIRNDQGQLLLNPAKKGKVKVQESVPVENVPDIGQELENIVIQHSLRGEEVFLREEETADQLGVGRTVLRAELTRMHGRGLLEHVPRRGWRVVGYNESRMLEYLEMRETLELKALDLAKGNLEVSVLKRLLKGNTPDAKGKTRIDDGLHAYLIDRAGNRFVKGFFQQHGAYHAALFNYASLAGTIISEMAEQHQAILQALLERDYAKARRCLSRHIRSQRPNVASLFGKMGEKVSRP